MYGIRRSKTGAPNALNSVYPSENKQANLVNQASICGFGKTSEDVRVPSIRQDYMEIVEYSFHLNEEKPHLCH